MTKFFSFLLSAIVASATFSFAAPASAETFDVPDNARITGTLDPDGTATITWTGVKGDTVVHFHGYRDAGWMMPIKANGNTVHLGKHGDKRFNGGLRDPATGLLDETNGKWWLWICYGVTPKGVLRHDPRLGDNLGIACNWIGPDGQPKAAIEFATPSTKWIN